jgi:hypothetical protein
VWYFFIGKQKVVLFPKYRKNGWESAASALSIGNNKKMKQRTIDALICSFCV